MSSSADEAKAPLHFSLQQAFYWMTVLCVLLVISVIGEGSWVLAVLLAPVSGMIYCWYWKQKKYLPKIYVIQAVLIICSPFVPVFNFYREFELSEICWSRFKGIGYAALCYHDLHNSFPPVAISDSTGTPLLSWRVSLLPHLDAGDLHRQFALNEPWNSTTNSKLILLHNFYHCPADNWPANATSYVAVTGEDTCWPKHAAIKFSDVTDGLSNTVLIVEQHKTGIIWSEPRDTNEQNIFPTIREAAITSKATSTPKQVLRNKKDFNHAQGAKVLFADGSIRTLSNDIDPEVLKQLTNRHDGLPKPADLD